MRQNIPLTASPVLLARLSKFVVMQTGLHFPQERWGDLERGIAAAAPDFNFSDWESCARWLLSTPLSYHINAVLASHLSIGETYFFREKPGLKVLEEQIFAQLLQSRRQNERRLRIWSAGCSTGEEAYTIAILLDRLIPDLAEWDITILATDFNPKFLHKAEQGVYGEWAFRDAPVWLRERYFSKIGDGRFELHSRIRKMVTFSYLNFVDEVYPSLFNNTSAVDVILCRNVLMYFTLKQAKRVISNFHRALADGGWLIVSPAEASNRLFSSFVPVEFPGAVLYRKTVKVESTSRVDKYWVPHSFQEAGAALQPLPVVQAATGVASADIYAVQGDQQPALQRDESGLSSCMARNCANQGKLGEALEWCNKAIFADKLNPAHHYLQATIFQEQEAYAAAMVSLTRSLYLDPKFVLAHFALGNLHQSQGNHLLAQRYFRNALVLLRKHPQDAILPEVDGLTAGRLVEIVTPLLTSPPP